MTLYETLYVIRPDLEEEAVESAIERFKGIVEGQGAVVKKVDKWGKRRLAYLINDYAEGHYVLMHFEGLPAAAQELERIQRISDEVLRYMTTRVGQ
jgi:small subunit ribosomal protein S6